MTLAPASEPRWTDRQQKLLASARSAALAAYCPYSKFRVGAAAVAGGKTYTGCNVENASYGLTVCAERAAIFSAIAAGNRQIDMIAIACIDASPENLSVRMPCGACRQVMAEFARSDIPILVDGVGPLRLSDLLPSPFVFAQP